MRKIRDYGVLCHVAHQWVRYTPSTFPMRFLHFGRNDSSIPNYGVQCHVERSAAGAKSSVSHPPHRGVQNTPCRRSMRFLHFGRNDSSIPNSPRRAGARSRRLLLRGTMSCCAPHSHSLPLEGKVAAEGRRMRWNGWTLFATMAAVTSHPPHPRPHGLRSLHRSSFPQQIHFVGIRWGPLYCPSPFLLITNIKENLSK